MPPETVETLDEHLRLHASCNVVHPLATVKEKERDGNGVLGLSVGGGYFLCM